MSLVNHLMDSIHNDVEALHNHGGLTRNNLALIDAILKNPSRDYEIGGSHAPPAYKLSSSEERPFINPWSGNEAQNPPVPKRSRAVDSPPVPARAIPSDGSGSQYPGSQFPGSQGPEKPARPVAPVKNEKLSSQYRHEQEEKKQESNDPKKNQYAAKVGDRVVMSGASGVGWGVGMGIARKLI